MNSKIILGLVGVAAVAGVYVATQSDHVKPEILGGAPANQALSYVPSDTLFFFGGKEAISLEDSVKMTQASMQDMGMLFPTDELLGQSQDNDAAKFLVTYYSDMLSALSDADKLTKEWGFAEKSQGAIYSVGMLPVMRVNLSDANAYKTKIEAIKTKAAVSSEQKTLGTAEYELFMLAKDGKAPLYVLHAVQEDHAVIALHVPSMDESYTKLILGQEKPQNSLADSKMLDGYQSKYGFDGRMLGFFNHVEIAKGITNPQGNRFGKMISFLSEQSADMNNDLAVVQTPACQNEISDIVNNWPATVFGYQEMNLDAKPISFKSKMIIESKDDVVLGALKKLRGFVPKTLNDNFDQSVFSFALGLNVSELPVSAMTIFNKMTTAQLSCEPLVEMQNNLKGGQQGVASLGMMSGMANGLQGISMSIMDIDFSLDEATETEQLKSLDSLVTISAENPAMLWNNAAAMVPPMQQVTLPADGEFVDFPLPMPLPVPLKSKIGLFGQHLGLTTGKASEALLGKVGQEALTNNGFMSFSMDYNKYFSLLSNAVANVPMDPSQKEAFDQLKNFNMKVKGTIDFTDNGIEFSGESVFN